MAGLKCNSYIFPVLQQVIIWNEVPMQHKYDIDAVDQCLRDLLEVSNHLCQKDGEQQLQWEQMIAHSPGYPIDIDRQPDRKERS